MVDLCAMNKMRNKVRRTASAISSVLAYASTLPVKLYSTCRFR